MCEGRFRRQWHLDQPAGTHRRVPATMFRWDGVCRHAYRHLYRHAHRHLLGMCHGTIGEALGRDAQKKYQRVRYTCRRRCRYGGAVSTPVAPRPASWNAFTSAGKHLPLRFARPPFFRVFRTSLCGFEPFETLLGMSLEVSGVHGKFAFENPSVSRQKKTRACACSNGTKKKRRWHLDQPARTHLRVRATCSPRCQSSRIRHSSAASLALPFADRQAVAVAASNDRL